MLRYRSGTLALSLYMQVEKTCGAQSGVQLCIVALAEGVQIFTQSAPDEFWLLGNERDVGPKRVEIDAVSRNAIEVDLPGRLDRSKECKRDR